MNRVKKAIILCLLLPAMCLSLCGCGLHDVADLLGIGDLGNLVHIGDWFDFDFGSGSNSADAGDSSVPDGSGESGATDDDASENGDIAVEMPEVVEK